MGAVVPAPPLLEVSGLKRYFFDRPFFGRRTTIRAVEDVSFNVRVGETLGLVGDSGCGKSTNGRMLVGLERPTAGSILYRGGDLAELSPAGWRDQRRELQIIFQNPQSALDPRMTIS